VPHVLVSKIGVFRSSVNVHNAAVMVSLQVRAYREHKHVSFLLLSIATTCALLYIVVGQILGFLRDTILAPPLWVFACVTAFLFVQMILGVWGTVSLFRSYGQLASLATSDEVLTIQISADGICHFLDSAVPCVDLGRYLLSKHLAQNGHINIKVDKDPKYELVAATLESLQRAGIKRKLGFINTDAPK
jgi:biopolymer transport protein ExbD